VAVHPAVQRAIVTLSLIGILYGGLVAMVQPDFKKADRLLVVAHLGFVMLGIWALTLQSVQGALLVMINHGISTGALFFLAGMLYERRHSRLIEAFGGNRQGLPMLSAVLTVASLSSIGLPATNWVRRGSSSCSDLPDVPPGGRHRDRRRGRRRDVSPPGAATRDFNPLDKSVNEKLADLSLREIAVLLAVAGLHRVDRGVPKPILQRMEPSALQLIQSIRFNAASFIGGPVSLDLANARDLLRALLPELALTWRSWGCCS